MKKHLTFFRFALVFLILNPTAFAQKQGRQRIDSLLVEIRNYKSVCQFSCLKDTAFISNSLLPAVIGFTSLNPDSASILLNSVFDFLKKVNWEKGYGGAYQAKGLIEYNTGKYPEALKSYEEAIKYWDKMLSQKKEENSILGNKANTLGNIGIIYMFQENYDKALEYYNKSLQISKQVNNSAGIGAQLNNIGLVHMNKHEYENALIYYNQSLEIRIKLNDKAGISTTTGNIGWVYGAKGDSPSALEYYFKALKIDEELKNADGVSRHLGNIGLLYQGQNKYEKALDYFLRALKISEDKNDKKGAEIVMGHIGNAYINMADKAKEKGDLVAESQNNDYALKYYLNASQLANEIGIKSHEATWIGNIGNVYQAKKEYKKALEYFFKSLRMTENRDKFYTAILYGNIGYTYYLSKNFPQSEKYLLQALSKSDSLSDLEGVLEVNKNLSELYSETNDYKKALDCYKKAMIAKDSLYSAEKTEEFIRKELDYEQQKKDAVAKLLQEKKDSEKNSEIEKQKIIRNSIAGGAGIILLSSLFIFMFYKRKRDAVQKQKETSLNLHVSETEMKALRSQMNPHFIFNALQSIQTFLLSHKPDDANTYLLKFSKLMRLVLENSQHSEVPLKEDMQALELYMQLESIRLKHPFTYQFHIADGIDPEETTIPPLILQPFVENAIWHGLQYKQEPGHIDIFISKKGNTLHATVEDNGIGRDMSKKVAQPMLLKKESLGMKLTEERLKILNELKNIKAHFTISDLLTKDEKPAGTKVELSLPLA